MTILIALVNPLTAALTFASLIGYAIVYTACLKRATPQNIVIGGVAGAAPPVLGWAAVTGSVHPYALLLVPDHLRVDAAAFLGARDLPPRRLFARAGADAAGHARRRVHALACAVLHDPAGAS